MKRIKVLLSLILVLAAGLVATGYASATPSADFYKIDDDVFDDWGICRTRAFGDDGFYQLSGTTFRPVIAFESLGKATAQAYNLGEQIAGKYSDKIQRAEVIFRFVRDGVSYTPDTDQFKCDEFAQNADELAITINQNGIGYGDCEDSAVLLAVMYKGAGYRSAIVIGSGHTAALVYLPDYDKASIVLELGGEPGWVWAEATGRNNPLGWMPREFINAELAAYEITEEEITPAKPTTAPAVAVAGTGGGAASRSFSFISVIGLLWLLSLFRRKRAH